MVNSHKFVATMEIDATDDLVARRIAQQLQRLIEKAFDNNDQDPVLEFHLYKNNEIEIG